MAALTAGLSDDQIDRLLASFSDREVAELLQDWPLWARPEQLPPASDWTTWLLMAGRGYGKTRAGAEWIVEQVRRTPNLRIALVGANYEDARAVMIDGESGLREVAGPLVERFYPSRRLLRFRNGGQAMLYSGASPDALRGPQHHFAWGDELAKWKRGEETWAMLQMGLRLGARPQALVTTTPRGGTILDELLRKPDTVQTGGSTWDNPHLSPVFRAAMEQRYGGTRLGLQELEGKLLTDVPGALWTAAIIAAARWPSEPAPAFTRVAIGVDPPSGAGTCGIVACAVDTMGRGHVLADHSITAVRPEQWAARVADAAALHGAIAADARALVVAERNQGGEMVRSVLLAAAPDLNVKLVTASQGKSHRAEPVALRFETGAAFFHGRFEPLEAQLMGFIAGGDYDGPGHSPDRADAMVWALTELLLTPKRSAPAVSGL